MRFESFVVNQKIKKDMILRQSCCRYVIIKNDSCVRISRYRYTYEEFGEHSRDSQEARVALGCDSIIPTHKLPAYNHNIFFFATNVDPNNDCEGDQSIHGHMHAELCSISATL